MSAQKKTARAVFAVKGANCVTCGLAIEKQIGKVGGVKDVKSSIMLNQVYVDYDESKVDLETIMKAIGRTGYSNNLIRKS